MWFNKYSGFLCEPNDLSSVPQPRVEGAKPHPIHVYVLTNKLKLKFKKRLEESEKECWFIIIVRGTCV